MEVNYLKIIQCDFLDFFLDPVSHSWGVPTMKIADLSILCKWENLKNRQCIKYLFAPLYVFDSLKITDSYESFFWRSDCTDATVWNWFNKKNQIISSIYLLISLYWLHHKFLIY